MRELTDHKLNGLNDVLKIMVADQPGPGNANHNYTIFLDESKRNDPKDKTVHQTISFQNGPINEVGVNGISNEALITVVIDRMRGFQSGQFACRENALALTKLEESLMWLQKRTADRLKRGVEGTSNK